MQGRGHHSITTWDGRRRAVLGALGASLLLALLAAPSALALSQRGHSPDFSFGEPGSGAGQLNRPLGVAVSESGHEVYVVDSANNRIDRYDSEGHFIEAWGWGVLDGKKKYEQCTTTCQAGLAGHGAYQLHGASAIAVDNSTVAGDPSAGDVYVQAVTAYEEEGGEFEYSVIDKFSPSGEKLGQIKGWKETGGSLEKFKEGLNGLTVDTGGDLLVSDEKTIYRFDDSKTNKPVSALESALEGQEPGIAADSEGNLYLAHEAAGGGESPVVIAKLDGSGAVLNEELDGEGSTGVAVDNSTSISDPSKGDVFVDNGTSVAVFTPGGSAIERFGITESKGVTPLAQGSGIAVDSNSEHGLVYVADAAAGRVDVFMLEEPGEPRIEEAAAKNTTATSTLLGAQINPSGAPTTFAFRYQPSGPVPGAGEECNAPCTEAPAGEEGIGGAYGGQSATAQVQGLQAGSTYHFRVLAKNVHGQVASAEHTFTTQPTASGFRLPDSRAWELVSPAKRNGASLEAITLEGGVIQASEDGSAITYLATGAIEGAEGSRSPEFAQIFSRRGAQGWSSRDIATPNERTEGVQAGNGAEYRFFSPSLSESLVQPLGTKPVEHPPLSKHATERTDYLRSATACESEPEGCFSALVTASNVPAGTVFGKTIEFLSATPDLSHSVLRSNAQLTETHAAGSNLYEWFGGALQLVNVLPKGTTTVIDPNASLSAVSCPSASFCAAVDRGGRAQRYNGRTWSPQEGSRVDFEAGLSSVSCPSASFCAALDASGNALLNSAGKWSLPASIDSGGGGLTSVSCSSESFCAALDAKGNALTYNGSTWSAPASIDAAGGLTSLSCPSESFCTALDASGNALSYNGRTWSTPASIDAAGGLTSVSCPSASFCAAVDKHGNALLYSAGSWSAPESIDTAGEPTSLSCPSASFCSAVDGSGGTVTYSGGSWGAAASETELGAAKGIFRHAISNDGSRIVWSTERQTGPEHIYMRDTQLGQTIQLDRPEAGVEEVGPTPSPHFQTASADGSRIFFTDYQRLTKSSTASFKAEKPDLYVCEVQENEAHQLECTLTDLSVDSHAGESADVQGLVLGVSEGSATSVYFVADGVLAAGAQPGRCRPGSAQASATCNLYVERYSEEERTWGAPTLIGALAQADRPDWGVGTNLGHVTSRVSPSGRYLTFMSSRSLTGYDNTDVNSGAADEEVYLYDSVTASLTCVSCNPTGARPAGLFDQLESGEGIGPLVDRSRIWNERWISGSIPGWTSVDVAHALYQSRYLSDSGRLFFNSSEALVPQDTNGKEDVYEYEPAGVGDCTASSPTFSAAAGGCVALISSGTSSHESVFLDASASGNDVFFLTASPLVAANQDSGFSLYDASVCGVEGTEPCISAPVAPPSQCEALQSCRPENPPAEGFSTPATSSAGPSGNIPAPTASQQVLHSKTVVKPLTRAQKLSQALRACKKDKKKGKRLACEKQARKQYGPIAKKKAKKSSAGAGRR